MYKTWYDNYVMLFGKRDALSIMHDDIFRILGKREMWENLSPSEQKIVIEKCVPSEP